MRILVINATTDLYGANRILSLALKTFPSESRIQLLLPELKGPLVAFIEKNNPGVIMVECPSLPVIQRKMFSISGGLQAIKLVKDFYRFLKYEHQKEPIDLLYVNTLSNFLVLPIASRLKIKTLVHVHEILESPKIVSQIINKYSLKWATSILAVSHAVKDNLLKAGSSFEDKIKVIHNGIPDLFSPDTTFKNDPDKCTITLIARIKPEKGIWYFLEALDLIKDKSSVRVRIIGGPAPFGEKYVNKLIQDITKSVIEIQYIPFTTEVSKYLNATDILVVPSIMKDPFPTTVLEGMCCAKAVVATDTGGAAEAIVHGQSGLLIKNDDTHRFALELDNLIADASERKRLGVNAREKYMKNFSISSYHNRMSQFVNIQLHSIQEKV
ncbi:glycosyltransferase family 4 protein [Anditalea andensis]|uniref:Glycosyl transferase family 1 domain-containing protein n=1 Tax=Anditalea andensis TaxID=1048983 RepID=A0A074KYZ5_9BACT|nr:glycosyltransferase family 4 protein [Anditalea andensis]KEO73455.1 hypothetical protein EL17_11140 [Anditalea andensis]